MSDDFSMLINRLKNQLRAKEIHLKAQKREHCLRILLEAQDLPDKTELVNFVQSFLSRHSVVGIDKVEVYGRRRGEGKPVWKDEFRLLGTTIKTSKELPDKVIAKSSQPSVKSKSFSSSKALNKRRKSPPKRATGKYRLVIGLAAFSIGFIAWIFTTEEYQNTTKEMPFTRAFGQAISSLFNSIPNGKTTFPDEKTSYIQAGELENVSYGDVKRLAVRIVVPLGRTQEELTATLERAAIEVSTATQADAITILAYRPQDTPTNQYTAGRAVYAPNGNWGDAASSEPKQISVDLNTLYFASASEMFASGDIVVLKDSTIQKVDLSREYNSWMDEDIIASVPNGTEAKVVEYRMEAIGDQELIRYKVRISTGGDIVDGWVHRSDVVRK